MAKQLAYTLSPSGKDDTAAIQDVLANAPDLSWILFQPGQYTVSAPLAALDKRLYIDGYNAILNWTGKGGVVLTLGFSSKSQAADGFAGSPWTVAGLQVHHTGKGEAFFANETTALRWQNVDEGRIYDLAVDGFGVGLELLGDGAGCSYGHYTIRHILNCRASLRARCLNGGFVTESTVEGGRWQNSKIAETTPTTFVDLAGPTIGGLRFRDNSFEGYPLCTAARLASVQYCHWLYPRFETTDLSKMPFLLDANTRYCSLEGNTAPWVDWRDATPANKTTNVFRPQG